MNIFDIIVAVLLLFGFIRGLMKGLLQEVASLASLIIGVYCAIHFSYFAEKYLKNIVSWKGDYISLAAFALTFLIVIVIIALAGKMLTKLADFVSLGILNKLLGGVFGALKIGLILSVVLLFFSRINNAIAFINNEMLEKAILYEPIKKIAPTIFPSILKDYQLKKEENNDNSTTI